MSFYDPAEDFTPFGQYYRDEEMDNLRDYMLTERAVLLDMCRGKDCCGELEVLEEGEGRISHDIVGRVFCSECGRDYGWKYLDGDWTGYQVPGQDEPLHNGDYEVKA